jgi:RNA polymerase sigma factor (TIGR02999 family)
MLDIEIGSGKTTRVPARDQGLAAGRAWRTILAAGSIDMSAGTDPPAGDASDPADAERLFATLYSELHRLARRELARRGSDITLGATTLLHEAYLDMSERGVVFPDRARFMAYAARAMRGLIIDYARRRYAQKRGGMFELTSLQTTIADRLTDANELQQISDALEDLAAVEPALAEIVDLKFFCGFSFAEIGAMRGMSERTVQRHWEKARLYLYRVLGNAPEGEAPPRT